MNPSAKKIGNTQLLKYNKTAFLCSRKTPESQVKLIEDWIKLLNPITDCILCGNYSEMEQKVFTMLLEYKIPTILVMPNAVAKRWDKDIMQGLEENRLLIFSVWDHQGTVEFEESQIDRNDIILLLADKIIVGFCQEGGKIERQIAGRDNVEILSAVNSPKLKHSKDLLSFHISSHSGDIYFDIKEDIQENYLKITQSKFLGNNERRREKIFINRSEIIEFRNAINKVLNYWSLEVKEEHFEKSYNPEQPGNAYLPWKKEADEYLISLYNEGKSLNELAEIFERNKGAIRSRLKKLGMINS